MRREYSSYLVRTWRLRSGEERVAIEHIQSGARVQLPSLALALAWLSARAEETAPAAPRSPSVDGPALSTPVMPDLVQGGMPCLSR